MMFLLFVIWIFVSPYMLTSDKLNRHGRYFSGGGGDKVTRIQCIIVADMTCLFKDRKISLVKAKDMDPQYTRSIPTRGVHR